MRETGATLTPDEWRWHPGNYGNGSSFSVSDQRRAEAILDAASRLFLAPGPGRVSMDDLARDLGMSKKTIYRHFPDKHSLMTAALDRQFGAIERILADTAVEAGRRSRSASGYGGS